MSLEQIEIDTKVAIRWYQKAMTIVSRTKLRVVVASILIVATIFMLPKLSALFLVKSAYQSSIPHYESTAAFYKKGDYLYLLDLLDACIIADEVDNNKAHYCSKAAEHYKYNIDKKYVSDAEQTLERKAYLLMKADTKFMLNRLKYRELESKYPEHTLPDLEFVFVWWFEALTVLGSILIGGFFYIFANQFRQNRIT